MVLDSTSALRSPVKNPCTSASKKPFSVPRTRPSIRMAPARVIGRRFGSMVKLVFRISRSPKSRICGRTHMTRKIEISVPIPRYRPIAEMVSFEVSSAMMIPADDSIRPEVIMVGKAWFRLSIMASFSGSFFLSSI